MNMKKLLSFILTMCILSTSFLSALPAIAAETTNEFTISSKDNFITFMTTSAYWEANYKVTLTCDIDMQGEVFDYIETFSGQFDGGEHTISNLSFKCFVKTNNGTISGVKFKNGKLIDDSNIQGAFVVTNETNGVIDNCSVDTNSEDASIRAGFVYENKGKITNSETTLSVKNNDLFDVMYVCGFVSRNYGNIENCKATGNVTSGFNRASGFVGYNYEGGTINNCKATGNVTYNLVESAGYTGGFVSRNYGNIENCTSTGNVTGYDTVGGFAGQNSGGTITECNATGSVIGNNSVGGFVGDSSGKINYCTATGDVTGSQYVGGFVGDSSGKINYCSATGDVTGSQYVGGFVGCNSSNGTITGAATGTVSGAGSNVGGFVGLNEGGTINNFAEEEEFIISDKNDFAFFMKTFGYWGNNQKVTLTCDLDMQNEAFDYIETFSGQFDGGEHTISNLSFKCFVKTNNGKISGIKFNGGKLINDSNIISGFVVKNEESGAIDNCSVDMNSEDANIKAGFVYENKGTITNSETTLSVKSDNGYAGGFVGCNNKGTITNCNATGTVRGSYEAGGFVGFNYGGTITECTATGNVTGNRELGGFVGFNWTGPITGCQATGTVISAVTGEDCVGGFVGYNYKGPIIDCNAEGNVTGNRRVGGFVGINNIGTVTNCNATGVVTGNDFVGAFVGWNNGTITGTSTGDVSGDNYVGGFVGCNGNGGTITECTAKGNLNGENVSLDGFAGINSGKINDCKID